MQCFNILNFVRFSHNFDKKFDATGMWGKFCHFFLRLIDLARKLDKADREALSKSAMYLRKMEQYAYAAEVYTKMGDTKALVMLQVEAKHWEEVCINIYMYVFIGMILCIFSRFTNLHSANKTCKAGVFAGAWSCHR